MGREEEAERQPQPSKQDKHDSAIPADDLEGSWKMLTFLSHFLENTQPRTHSLMENYCSSSCNAAKTQAAGRAGETVCDALQSGHDGTRLRYWCTPAIHLPAWLSKCPLSPAAAASSPRSSQLLCLGTSRGNPHPWLLYPTLPAGVPVCERHHHEGQILLGLAFLLQLAR